MVRIHNANQLRGIYALKNEMDGKQKVMKVEFNNETKKSEIVIHGVIGPEDWENAISLKDINNALKSVKGDLVIFINSPGGDMAEGIAIYEKLLSHKKSKNSKVNVVVNGYACSAASIIAMAGDKLEMGVGSMLKFTNVSSLVMGTKTDILKAATELDKLDVRAIDIYMTKAAISRKEIQKMMEDETWISTQKASEIGLITP